MQIAPGASTPSIRETTRPPTARDLAAPQSNEPAKPAKTAEQSGPKTTPLGLERALTRLQSIPEPDRTSGQSNAIDSISRNIARYTENGAVSTPALEPADPDAIGNSDNTLPDVPARTGLS